MVVQISEHISLYPETYLILAYSDEILKLSSTVLQNIQQSVEHNKNKAIFLFSPCFNREFHDHGEINFIIM